MTDLDALRRAILDHPDDDTPRLIYADALEEAGEPRRAAFVRAQVELTRVPPYDPFAVRYEHHDRTRLFDPTWIAELPDLPDGLQWAREPFRRGFPAVIQARDGAAFVAHAEAVFAAHPVEVVVFSGVVRAAEAQPLADCAWLNRITRLEFPAGLSGQVARRVFRSPHLGRLTDLHVGGAMTVPTAAQNLVGSPAFARLTGLSWRDDARTGGAVVQQLIRLADPPDLRRLDLSGNRISPERAGRLAAAPALSAVEELDLSDNHLGPDGMRAVAAGSLPRLRSLSLMRTRPGEDGVKALAAGRFLPELRALSLGGNNLGPAAGYALAESSRTGNLRVLDLRDNRLGDAGVAALTESPDLRNLIHLDLSANGVEDMGADALAASPHLGGLIALDLGSNIISPPAAKRLRDRFGDRVLL